ncbi:MAG: hypothetical protein K2X03_11865 [Bryobacteraceae bacterium]|nr:hypothetical protein [Bryobacteraceae bacterium]
MYHNQSDDVIEEPFVYDRGTLRAPTGIGLGVRIQPDQLRSLGTSVFANPYLNPDRPEWFPTKPQY